MEEIDRAIKILAGKIIQPIAPLDAQQIAQAALSFANTKATLIMLEDPGPQATQAPKKRVGRPPANKGPDD